jgi:hypothetical protein
MKINLNKHKQEQEHEKWTPLVFPFVCFGVDVFCYCVCFVCCDCCLSFQVDDDEYWLTYWVVYGSLSVLESFLDAAFFWLPFYFLIKV